MIKIKSTAIVCAPIFLFTSLTLNAARHEPENKPEVITISYSYHGYTGPDWSAFFYNEMGSSEARGYFGYEGGGGGGSSKSKKKLTAKEKAQKMTECLESVGDSFVICNKRWDANIAAGKEGCELYGSVFADIPYVGKAIESHLNYHLKCSRTAAEQRVDQEVACRTLRTKQTAVCRNKYS